MTEEEDKIDTFTPLWQELMDIGREVEKEGESIGHTMGDSEIDRFRSTIDVALPMGVGDPIALNQIMMYDINVAQYRVYDFVGMVMGGRWGDELRPWAAAVARAYIKVATEDEGITREYLYSHLYDAIVKELTK